MSILIWLGDEHSAVFFPIVFAVLYLAMVFFARHTETRLFGRDMLWDPVWAIGSSVVVLMFGYSVTNGIVGQINEFGEIFLLLLVLAGLMALANMATMPVESASAEPAAA